VWRVASNLEAQIKKGNGQRKDLSRNKNKIGVAKKILLWFGQNFMRSMLSFLLIGEIIFD
jgi:hypothetical protein